MVQHGEASSAKTANVHDSKSQNYLPTSELVVMTKSKRFWGSLTLNLRNFAILVFMTLCSLVIIAVVVRVL